MLNPREFFISRRLDNNQQEIYNDWEYTLKSITINEFLIHFDQYLENNYNPFDFEEQFWEEMDELSIIYKHPREEYFPIENKIQKGDFGEALCSYVVSHFFNIDIPVLPWARKIARDKPISNFDLIGYELVNNKISRFYIFTSKCSPKLRNLRSLISDTSKEFRELTQSQLITKLHLFYRLFQSEIDESLFNDYLSRFLRDIIRNPIKIIGFFTCSNKAQLENCGTKFGDLNGYLSGNRHIIRIKYIRAIIRYFFRRI